MPAQLADSGGAWALHLPCFEAGEHRVAVSLDGAKIGSGALTLHAEPGAACLDTSGFEGAGLLECTAGVPAKFGIQARDAHGHAVTGSGAAGGFSVDILAGEERCQGARVATPPACLSVSLVMTCSKAFQRCKGCLLPCCDRQLCPIPCFRVSVW